MSWIDPATNATEGLSAFLGYTMPVIMWIALVLAIGFTIVMLMRRVFAATA